MTTSTGRARTTQPMLALLAGAALTLAALVAARPRFSGGPTSWTGDDLAMACLWWGAALASAWLGASTLACVAALARGHTSAAHRVAGWAPPLARRVLQAALVSTWALVPAAAYAAPPSGPVIVYVGADGRLTTGSGRAVASDEPVVRTPATSTPTTAATATTTTTAPTATPPPSRRPIVPATSPTHARSIPATSIRVRNRSYVVRSGDNLWRIARAEVTRTSGVARPDDSAIAPYWQQVIAANRATLRSGDPSLIFPGEVVTLPPSR